MKLQSLQRLLTVAICFSGLTGCDFEKTPLGMVLGGEQSGVCDAAKADGTTVENKVMVTLSGKDGQEIYEGRVLKALYHATVIVSVKTAHVDPSTVSSLFTPSTRYVELKEGGLTGGPVIPAQYDVDNPKPTLFPVIKDNVIKSGIVGRLVSVDHRHALVMADIIEVNPLTGEKADYAQIRKDLDEHVVTHMKTHYPELSIAILGPCNS